MIKKVVLKNFESHEDTSIEFTNGLNLVVGQSNQGKSSIVRAIAMVAANRFDRDCVRTGKDFCTVTVETEKGSITAERGEDVNRWTVQKQGEKPKTYKNIGTGVPPEALEILGMGERVHGEMRELPNIMFQLEKHYMLSEIDGKKATSNQIARMMDEAIGIGGMEELIRDMANDLASDKKELNTCLSEISELKSRMMDEDIFEECSRSVEDMNKARGQVSSTEKLLSDASELSESLERTTDSLSRVDGELELLGVALEQGDRVSSLVSRLGQLLGMRERGSQLAVLGEEMEGIASAMGSYSSVESLVEKYRLYSRGAEVSASLGRIADMGEIPSREDVERIDALGKRIESATSLLEHARDVYRKMVRAGQGFIKCSNELEDCEARLDSLKKNIGVCPLCGREF